MCAPRVGVLGEARPDHVARLAASDRRGDLLARLSLDAPEHGSLVLGQRLFVPARARRFRVDPAEASPLLTPVRHVSLLFVMRVRYGGSIPLLVEGHEPPVCCARHGLRPLRCRGTPPRLYLGPSSGSPTWRPVAPVRPVAAAYHPIPPRSDSPCGPSGRSLLRSAANAPPGSRGHRRGCRGDAHRRAWRLPSASPPGAERGR